MTEKKLFMQWVEKENALLLQEAQEGSQFHKDILDYMFMGWEASTKRIDDVVKSLEGVKSTGFRPHCYDYDKGWRDCAITTLNDLKGDKK